MSEFIYGSKALLIEDETINQKIACVVLKRVHCQVDIAATGAEALLLAGKNNYDIILSDLGLPDVEGIDLLRIMRSELKITTPVIVLTAHGGALEQECFNAGANDFFTKPVNLSVLEAHVKKWLFEQAPAPVESMTKNIKMSFR